MDAPVRSSRMIEGVFAMSAKPSSGSPLGRWALKLQSFNRLARGRFGQRGLVAALEDAKRRGDSEQTIALASRLLDRPDLLAAGRHAALSARARARLHTGDFANAVLDTEAALAIEPKDGYLWFNQGFARFRLGQFRAAAACFERAAGIKSDRDALIWCVVSYCETEDWSAARLAAENLVRDYPSNVDSLRWRAHVKRKSGDREGALADCTTALTGRPGDDTRRELLRSRAGLLIELGRVQEAIADCSEFLVLVPEDEDMIARRAELRESTGDLEGAILDFRRIRHSFACAVEEIRLLIRNGDRAALRDALAAALARWPYDPGLLRHHDVERARTLIDAGDKDAAMDHLNSAIAVSPRDPELRTVRGGLYLDNERWREAILDFDVVLRREPRSAAAWLGRAKAHVALGKPYLALADARKALRVAPADPLARAIAEQAGRELAHLKASAPGQGSSVRDDRLLVAVRRVISWIAFDEAEKDARKDVGGWGGVIAKGQGWVEYLAAVDPRLKDHYEALREAVISRGLRRGGDWHQHAPDGVAVFDDDAIATSSFRAWGDLMAAIWASEDCRDYGYMDFYMDCCLEDAGIQPCPPF
jgi:tetratricopeptide (TPR) repeat protein